MTLPNESIFVFLLVLFIFRDEGSLLTYCLMAKFRCLELKRLLLLPVPGPFTARNKSTLTKSQAVGGLL